MMVHVGRKLQQSTNGWVSIACLTETVADTMSLFHIVQSLSCQPMDASFGMLLFHSFTLCSKTACTRIWFYGCNLSFDSIFISRTWIVFCFFIPSSKTPQNLLFNASTSQPLTKQRKFCSTGLEGWFSVLAQQVNIYTVAHGWTDWNRSFGTWRLATSP